MKILESVSWVCLIFLGSRYWVQFFITKSFMCKMDRTTFFWNAAFSHLGLFFTKYINSLHGHLKQNSFDIKYSVNICTSILVFTLINVLVELLLSNIYNFQADHFFKLCAKKSTSLSALFNSQPRAATLPSCLSTVWKPWWWRRVSLVMTLTSSIHIPAALASRPTQTFQAPCRA